MKRVLLGVIAALALAAPAQAADYVVTGTGDGGTCEGGSCPSLRAALEATNGQPDADTITLPSGTIALTNGALTISHPVTITGAGADLTTIRGDAAGGRVLEISGPTATLNDLALQGGSAPAGPGGSLVSQGSTVALTRIHVFGGSALRGGGIANLHGNMTINESLIDSNAATGIGAEGGGVVNVGDGLGEASMTIHNSTIAFNTAPLAGGLSSYGNGLNSLSTTGVTIAKNLAGAGGTGGMLIGQGTWTAESTLVSDNFQDGQVVSNCTGTDASSNGWNVENFTDCGFTQAVDRDNVGDAGLATSLDANDGPTPTMKLLAGSPALSIRTTGCTGVDQRGFARPQGSGCDAGAFESELIPGPPPTITTPAPSTYRNIREVPFSGTAQPGETVNVFLGFALQQTTEANAQGVWTTEVELPDADGLYTYEARTPTSTSGATVAITLDRDAPETTIETRPENPSGSSTATFTYSSDEPETTFSCRLLGHPDPSYGLCPATGQTYTGLANGEYTFTVRATDRAGNTDGTEATYTFSVNTGVAPTIAAPAADTYTNAATLDFAGTATPSVGVDLYRGTTLIEEGGADGAGAWSFEDIELGAEGEYLYRVEAGGQSAAVRVVVDRTQPAPAVAPPATEPEAATLTFGAAAEPTASFTCRLEGPGRGPEFAPCSSPLRFDALTAGAYRFTVRAVDAAGNSADSAPQEFTIAGVPPVVVPQPSPTPTPRPTQTPTPQPDVGKTVVIRPTGGKVLIKLFGSNQFVEVKSLEEIPLGATIDTKNGRIQLRFETEDGKVQTATFYGGIFQVRQVGKILDLKLTEALAACPRKGKAAAAQTKKAKKRKLWGDGKGSFRTTGKYSAATVRGTKWLVEDSCAGTLTRVTSGVVAVRAGKRTVLVRAGKRYLAKPR